MTLSPVPVTGTGDFLFGATAFTRCHGAAGGVAAFPVARTVTHRFRMPRCYNAGVPPTISGGMAADVFSR